METIKYNEMVWNTIKALDLKEMFGNSIKFNNRMKTHIVYTYHL